MTKILLENDFAKITSILLSTDDSTEDINSLKISHPHCEAAVSLYGGHVLNFKPTGHEDVIWLSDTTSYQSGKAIRGGIPLCWPWFGPHDKATEEQPAEKHGFARQLPWELDSINADEHGITLVLSLVGESQHPLWPNAYRLKQTLFFGKHFTQTLAMTNLATDDAQYCGALHSYFTVSNPSNVSIDALTGVSYIDKVMGSSSLQQEPVSCVGEIDRVYQSNEKMSLVDNQWQRKIEIVSSNCQQWVLWNPGVELANRMADIHPGGEQEYVCLEAANTAWQVLPAGETVTISQEITVSKL